MKKTYSVTTKFVMFGSWCAPIPGLGGAEALLDYKWINFPDIEIKVRVSDMLASHYQDMVKREPDMVTSEIPENNELEEVIAAALKEDPDTVVYEIPVKGEVASPDDTIESNIDYDGEYEEYTFTTCDFLEISQSRSFNLELTDKYDSVHDAYDGSLVVELRWNMSYDFDYDFTLEEVKQAVIKAMFKWAPSIEYAIPTEEQDILLIPEPDSTPEGIVEGDKYHLAWPSPEWSDLDEETITKPKIDSEGIGLEIELTEVSDGVFTGREELNKIVSNFDE